MLTACRRLKYRRRSFGIVILGLIGVLALSAVIHNTMCCQEKPRLYTGRKDLIITPADVSNFRKNHVLLSAYMNSGSRFTGRILGYSNQSFFFYEPLWKFSLWDYFRPPNLSCSSTEDGCRSVRLSDINFYKPLSDSEETKPIVENMTNAVLPSDLFLHVLSSIYNCSLVRLKNVIQDRVHDHPSYAGPSWDAYRACIRRFEARSACLRQLETICRNRDNRITKVLRLTLGSFRPLLETNPRLKIVHLVRDPRAIINSRLFSRYYPVYGYRDNNALEKSLCDKMRQDYVDGMSLMKRFPERVKFLYYEDLMSNLHVRLKRLYSFLGMTYNITEVDILAKVQVNLSPPEKGNDFFDDRRNMNWAWWRKHMQMSDVKRVDGACADVYDMYGYKYLKNEKYVKNLKYPSLQIPHHLQI